MGYPNKIMSLVGRRGGSPISIKNLFAVNTYTGNGTSQAIINNINLARDSGALFIKQLNDTSYPAFVDEAWTDIRLRLTSIPLSQEAPNTFQYRTNGFFINTPDSNFNTSGGSYIAYSFKEHNAFFATAFANVSSTVNIDFSQLGTIGMVMVQGGFGNNSPFWIWHRSLSAGQLLQMNNTNAQTSSAAISVSGTTVTLNSSAYTGGGVVVYAWAHNPGTSGWIDFGTYTGNGSSTGPDIDLDWPISWLLVKRADSTGNWLIYDNVRDTTNPNTYTISTNLTSAQNASGPGIDFTSSGFQPSSTDASINASGGTYIYGAIRSAA